MKQLRFFIFFILLFAASAMFFSCKNAKNPQEQPPAFSEEKPLMLFLGDSIGEALAGPTPLTEREDYGYYGLIGNINGYEYYNRAVTGYTTLDLLNYVQRDDDGINMTKSLISTADIIHISILGNDFLNSSHSQMMIDLSNEVYTRIQVRQENASNNIDQTIKIIRELNPNATLILQTLYNPTGHNSPLITTYARNVLSRKGIEPSNYHELMGKMIHEINKILTDYLTKNTTVDKNGVETKPFELIDVYSTFESIYETDYTRWERLFCEDGVHPSSEGHALIAEVLQKKLEELSFAAPSAFHSYKQIKATQLKRLYSDLPNIDITRSSIMKASSYSEATLAYFNATTELIPHYEKEFVSQGKTFDKDVILNVTKATVYGKEIAPLLDENKSYIIFKADGTYELKLTLKKYVTEIIRYAIEENAPINIDDYFDFELAILYFGNFAPGVDKGDLKAILDTIENLYGFSFTGVDFENKKTKEMLEHYRQTFDIIIDSKEIINGDVCFKNFGSYRLQEVTSKLTNKTYTAIYINNAIGKSESYIRYTYENTEDGNQHVRATVDVAKIEVEGETYAQK